jgi:2,3-bisphosphoglycerate-independent phosphoglycerate mutase
MGEHMSGFPGPKLRKWVEEDNIYKQAIRLGKKSTFANAYTSDFFEKRMTQRGWVSVSTATMLSAKLPLRNLSDLQNGKAVYYDITHIHLKEKVTEIPIIAPEQAADHLLDLSNENDLTVFEYFLTDVAGHRQDLSMLEWVLGNYDRFLGRLVDRLPNDCTLVLTSDHGNCEDLTHKGHTSNHVPTIIVGQGAERIRSIRDLTDITPAIIELLKIE